MACIICKEEKELCIDFETCKLCSGCLVKHNKAKLIELKNNCLSYIRQIRSCSTKNVAKEQCDKNYSELSGHMTKFPRGNLGDWFKIG